MNRPMEVRAVLDLNELSRLLEESGEEYAESRDEADGEVAEYSKVLASIPGLDPAVLEGLPPLAGARPLEPLKDGVFVPFREEWKDKEGCLEWMDGVLAERTVGAVDGSQIYPDMGTGVPTAVLQAGIALNVRGGGVDRRSKLRVLGPRQFVESVFADMPVTSLVDAQRFELECEATLSVMEEHGDAVVLMDYPLLVPHLMGYQDRLRYTYLHAVRRLLRKGREGGIPLVGFVDRSISRDLTYLLYHISRARRSRSPLPRPRWTYDGRLLRREARWGVRTRAFILDRDDRRGEAGTASLDLYEEFRDGLAFMYVCTDGGTFSRVEFPRYVYDSGRLDEVVDVILAQTALRGNYPDMLHQAHKTATITRGDADLFERMFDRFCSEKGMVRDRSGKEMHKRYNGPRGRRR